jgi:leucyl aminopeptidase
VDVWSGHTLVLFVRAREEGEEGPPELGRIGDSVDKEIGGVLKQFVEEESFDGKVGSCKVAQVFGKDVKRVALVGVGPSSKASEVDWRLAGATAAGALKELKGGTAGFACIDGVEVQALVEGILLGLHTDKRMKGTKTPEKERKGGGPEKIEVLGAFPPGSAASVEKAQSVAKGVIFARELVNGSANIVTPASLAEAAEDMAKRLGLSAKIIDADECEKMGMGSFLAVGRASDVSPRLIHLTYKPEGEVKRKVGIVGKGLTFDSGGYNIKTMMIEMMKFDMGGAAATLGTAAAIAQLKPADTEVHFVIAACENLISGKEGVLRPGDIITAMDGTTIEVNNTDAEGRLTLADALLYTQQQGATEVIDIATLTGACIIGLGQDITGMWSNSDDLAGRLEATSKEVGEKMWRMPLEDAYWEGMKSEFADMVNTGPRWGGSITAALFLQKFIQKDVTWAHLDIAGPCWAEKPKGLNTVAGGTGCMVRTLTSILS